MSNFLQNLIALSLEAAPWLVIGLTLGGLMKALIPASFLQKHLAGDSFSSVSKAALLGAPLPLCSCGVIPAALGLRKAGASKPATASFLVSTPETGIDSITITYALMGPFMAIVRPIAAIISALGAGMLVAKFDPEEVEKPLSQAPEKTASSCCNSAKPKENSCCTPEPVVSSCCTSEAPKTMSCCSSSTKSKTVKDSRVTQAYDGVRYAFTNLMDDIVLWLVAGMVFAAAVNSFLPETFLTQWGSGLTAMIVMLLAGIPMYICATASTPVAAGLMMAGVSPGVALVLLLTGPATNISTLGIISKELGKRSMWLYLAAVSITAICAGLLVNKLVVVWNIDIQAQLGHAQDGFSMWIQWLALLLLVAVALRKYLPLESLGKLLGRFRLQNA